LAEQHLSRLIQCSSCGHSVDYTARLCPACGNDDVNGKTCLHCQKRMPKKTMTTGPDQLQFLCKDCADKLFSYRGEIECNTCKNREHIEIGLARDPRSKDETVVLARPENRRWRDAACSRCGRGREQPEKCKLCGMHIMFYHDREKRDFLVEYMGSRTNEKFPVHWFCLDLYDPEVHPLKKERHIPDKIACGCILLALLLLMVSIWVREIV